ncbi:MAG: hypothetical protein GY835_09445, partial [bacterium]|nr:hypothetical protein [bacterium]
AKMPTTMADATGTTATTSASHAGHGGLGFRPLQPNAYLQHPGTPPIPFQMWLMSFKGYVHLLQFDRAMLDEGIKKTLLFQLLGTEGMCQFGNEPATARLEDNVYSFIAFCNALETFFHKPVKPAWARLELHNRRQGAQESAAEFVASLRELLPDCRFDAEHQLEHLATQVLAGCRSDSARKRMLLEENIDLDRFAEILVSEESVARDMVAFGAQASAHC